MSSIKSLRKLFQSMDPVPTALENLLDLAMDPNAEYPKGKPLLVSCIQSRYPAETIELLLKRGADPNTKWVGRSHEIDIQSALACACVYPGRRDRIDIVKLLVNAGAKTDDVDESGNTAIDYMIREIAGFRSYYGWDWTTREYVICSALSNFFFSADPAMAAMEYLLSVGGKSGRLTESEVHTWFDQQIEYWNACQDWFAAHCERLAEPDSSIPL